MVEWAEQSAHKPPRIVARHLHEITIIIISSQGRVCAQDSRRSLAESNQNTMETFNKLKKIENATLNF